MKKGFIIFISLLFLLFPIVSFSLDTYVSDDASLLSNETVDYMNQYSTYLDESLEVSFLTMTLEHLEDYDIDYYSEVLFEEYHLGDRGVLILFVNDKKNLKIITGEDLSNYLTTNDLDDIIDQFFAPYIKNHEYDKGLKNGYSALYKYICSIYGIDDLDVEVHDGNDFFIKYKTIILIGALSLALLITYFFCIFFKSFYHTKKHTITDYLMFGIVLFSNIVLICFAYSLEPISVFVYLAIVLYVIMSVFGKGNKVDYEEAFYKVKEYENKKLKRKRKRK